jgi:SIR2-like protein
MRALILGAGASRAVSYASKRSIPSPLDADFFDLLQRIEPQETDAQAVHSIINHVLERPSESLWNSMERMFYTLHMRASMSKTLFPKENEDQEDRFLGDFTRATIALLRAAHGQSVCLNHSSVFLGIGSSDAIITFNYDLVCERALRQFWKHVPFGLWLYGLDETARRKRRGPILYKLHGSVNWKDDKDSEKVILGQETWKDFDKQPGYRGKGPEFPILLPYWDKKIEEFPWRDIWGKAAQDLRETRSLLIWGYSLPQTDLKALELVSASLCSDKSILEEVCVVDPSPGTRSRWRSIFFRQKFWPFGKIEEFLHDPPPSWSESRKNDDE